MTTDRINQILYHQLFRQYMQANETKEENRIFCKHNMAHVLDVARIAYLLNIEENYGISKEMIYAAALLHDIGRHVQYETGEKHAIVSARLAKNILYECGFQEDEMTIIINAIAEHGNKKLLQEKNLNGLLVRADVLSRACYACKAKADCNWSLERKNKKLEW